MLSFLQRISQNFIHKSTYLRQTPLNRVSLVILILIDIFVLINVFSGLNSIADFPLNPTEEFPCFSAYETYQTAKDKGTFAYNVSTIENLIQLNISPSSFVDHTPRLGQISNLCANYQRSSQGIKTPETVKLQSQVESLRKEISALKGNNQTLESQYNSTLLEKIAGQAPEKSINQVRAEQVKAKIDNNKTQIANKEKQITEQQTKLLEYPNIQDYLKLLNNNAEYEVIKKSYDSAEFWYPNKILLLQTLFLLPLIIISYFWHTISISKNYGLPALLAWHLLLIFCLPLLIKVFEFLQFGNLFAIVIEWIVKIFGGLRFIASYALIVVIPLVGLGLIKVLQVWLFNHRVQAKKRIAKVRCINCNYQLRLSDEFCSSCGFNQYVDCPNCHQKTYQLSNYCRHCGHKIE